MALQAHSDYVLRIPDITDAIPPQIIVDPADTPQEKEAGSSYTVRFYYYAGDNPVATNFLNIFMNAARNARASGTVPSATVTPAAPIAGYLQNRNTLHPAGYQFHRAGSIAGSVPNRAAVGDDGETFYGRIYIGTTITAPN